MKINMVAYLSKEGVGVNELLDVDRSVESVELDLNYHRANLFLKTSKNKPGWSHLFQGYLEDPSIFDQRTVRGVLVVPVRERLIAFTFGHGRSLLNKQSIERGFGLRVAMNLGDSNQLKSIDKSTLDKVALNTRSQSSKKTDVHDFNFEFDHEIMKSITAIVDRPDDELEVVSGSDSVALYTDVELHRINSVAERLISAYKSDNYKEFYPWADYIKPETDPDVKDALDTLLVGKLNSRELDEFWMAVPEIIDFSDFSGFCYRAGGEPVKHFELNLGSFLEEAGFRSGVVSNTTIKNKKVFLLDSNDAFIDSWSFFSCICGEVAWNDKRYILNDGVWYSISDDFYQEVCSFFDGIEFTDLKFPNYGELKEGDYLKAVSEVTDFVLLDQKWVRPKDVPNNLEFCDLYSPCKAIIHVKKYGASSVLNHLFAQAGQSVEMLVNSPEVRAQVDGHLRHSGLTIDFKEDGEREHRVVLAIMYPNTGPLEIPFFAKVSLRQYARRIRNMGFDVELAKILLGQRVFNSKDELIEEYQTEV